MGKIALAKLDPTRLASALAATRTERISLSEAEARFDLPAHDQIGSRLAKLWRFPATLATPIEQHHAIHRVEVRDRLAPNLRTISEIVCVADVIAERCTGAFVKGAGDVEAGWPLALARCGTWRPRSPREVSAGPGPPARSTSARTNPLAPAPPSRARWRERVLSG